jgi:hypothetical protein
VFGTAEVLWVGTDRTVVSLCVTTIWAGISGTTALLCVVGMVGVLWGASYVDI